MILVLIYLVVATAALAFGGAAQLNGKDEVLNLLGRSSAIRSTRS